MMRLFNELFGNGKDLTALQMGDRSIVMFFITLVLIRISGMRTFGTKSAFDNIIVIMLGAILSRGVSGSSPFIPTVISGLCLALTHRILAVLTVENKFVSKLTEGSEVCLFKNGKLLQDNMKKVSVSLADLMESLRRNANISSLDEVDMAYMERNGEISVVKKNSFI